MHTFLQTVAYDLYDKTGGNFQDVVVVFPNKRATIFFNKYLWERSDHTTMWTPQYLTISELFASMSSLIIADPIYLIGQLHEVYRSHFPDDARSFDELYSLLEMMLADFDDVDSNLVPADKIFRNVKELQDLTDFSFLEPEQVAAIQRFFNEQDWQNATKEQRQFASLWDKLLDIYADFQHLLLSQPDQLVYEGMLKRSVAEQKPVLKGDKLYAFVGFNVLNRAEKALLHHIKDNANTLFYWDYDTTFCNPLQASDPQQRGYEAGAFILENINEFGSVFTPQSPLYNNMAAAEKQITFIKTTTENAQARYVHQWVGEKISPDTPLTDYAIVLCDETLLLPTLHSTPSPALPLKGEGEAPLNPPSRGEEKLPLSMGTSVVGNFSAPSPCGEGRGGVINVTMGYPLSQTPAYSLVQALLELQLRGRTKRGTWRYKQTAAVLKHPYIRRMTNGESSAMLSCMIASNIIFPTDDTFASHPLLDHIFTKRTHAELIDYIANTLTHAAGAGWDKSPNDFDHQLYKESIFATYTAINKIKQSLHPANAPTKAALVARLIYQALRRVTVPFHGEPADGMQVMGFLETRNLDFKHVVILSAGEGQMPRSEKRPSLIPYTLQTAFGMTTIDKEISIYAYYFYRLIARAQSVTILWNGSTADGSKGEMSRFMTQMMVESEQLFHPNQHIDLQSLVTKSLTFKTKPLVVEKNDEMFSKMRQRFSGAILSPSAINCYLQCQMRFFLNYVAHLRTDDEIAEDVTDAAFGTIFHRAMQLLYTPHLGKPISSSLLRAMSSDDPTLCKTLDQAFEDSGCHPNSGGANLIKHKVLRILIQHQLLTDARVAEKAESAGNSLIVMQMEEDHRTTYTFTPEGSDTPVSVLLGGIIDRIDMAGGAIRIVDYKTSIKPQVADGVEVLFDIDKAHKCYHITQTLYYCDVLYNEAKSGNGTLPCAAHTPIQPNLMYYQNNMNGKSSVIRLKYGGSKSKQEIQDYVADVGDEYHDHITSVIKEIFSPGQFTSNPSDENCKYCDFKQICSPS